MKTINKSLTIFLLIISIMFMSIFFIDNVKGSTQESNIEYMFKNNVLADDSLIPNKMNLRHNNIFTQDYNGTYSFINDTIGNVPIGWNNLSVGNANCSIQSNFNKHDSILNLSVIDNDNAKIEQTFYDGIQTNGIIEFWFGSSDCTYINNAQLLSDDTIGVFFRIISDEFQYYDASWLTLDSIPLDNEWYHIKFDFDCTTDKIDIYIDDYYEGNYGFINPVNSFNKLQFEIVDLGIYSSFVDAVGYPFSSNYTLNENKYPIIEIVDSDIISNDKYEFNLQNNSNPYNILSYDDVDFFDRHTPTIYHVYPDIPHFYMDSKNINGIKIIVDNEGSATGIKNESLGIKFSNINITFGFQYTSTVELNSFIDFALYSYNNTQTIRLRLDTQTTYKANLNYYNGVDNILLDTIYGIDNTSTDFNFNLFLNENFNVNLIRYENDIFNNSYSFPLVFNHSGINQLKFYAYDNIENSDYFQLRLNYIGIYQNNISLCREKDYLSYYLENDWSYNIYNLFEVISNQSIKIISYGYFGIDKIFHIFREFDNQTFFYNLHEQLVRDEGFTVINPYLYLIFKSNYNISESIDLSIKGVKIEKYVDDIFTEMTTLKFTYSSSVDRNYSFYYVDNNRLNYQLTITQNDTQEYILLFFDFARHIYTNNKTIYFKGRQTPISIGKAILKINYWIAPAHYYYELKPYFESVETLLEYGHELNRFYFYTDDFNYNNFTGYISRGYIYDLRIGYYPYEHIPHITLATLSLIAIIIPLIIILAPTFLIHMVYRKKGAIIPMLIFFSIITFATNLIPFQIFFVIMIALGSGLFLQYKHQKEV